MMGGCRVTHQVREWEILGIYSKLGFTRNSRPSSPNSHLRRQGRLLGRKSTGVVGSRREAISFRPPLVSCLQSKSPGDSPALSDCVSQKEDNNDHSSEGLTSIAGGIVALGKFDALHIGHRELAVQASKVGAPYLLSLVGMAEVLGWEPRAPIVAACDRKRVLSLWAPYCGDIVPQEFTVKFSTVRQLTPREFVEKLAKEFGVSGIVAGENYRFGYRAAGDASDLVRLCDEYGIGAYIIRSVMDKNQIIGNSFPDSTKERGQVSSTRVRYALAKGDVNYVKELLGRRHRVILSLKNQEVRIDREHGSVSASTSCLLNLPPQNGYYNKCTLVVGDENLLPCRVTIDSENIWLDFDEVDRFLHLTHDVQLLGIEFGSD